MKFKNYLTLFDLQLFADDSSGADDVADDTTDDADADDSTDDDKPRAKYTDDDVNEIVKKKLADAEKKRKKEVDEAKRLAGMSAQEKNAHELAETKAQLAELLKAQSLTKMTGTARGILSDKGLNVGDELLSMLVSEDADRTKAVIDDFIKLVLELKDKGIKDALKGEPPKKAGASTLTKEDIMKVASTRERLKLIKENRNLFE